MASDCMLFVPDVDHGRLLSQHLSPSQKTEIEKAVPAQAQLGQYLQMLYAHSELYLRHCVLKAMEVLLRQTPPSISADERTQLLDIWFSEVNQHLSWHIARMLVVLGDIDGLLHGAQQAPLEVTRFVAVLELNNLLADYAQHQTKQAESARLMQVLRAVTLSDSSNYVRNYIVAFVLDFENRYPAAWVQYCRQWYHTAARLTGVPPKLQQPYVADYLGADQSRVLAPVRQTVQSSIASGGAPATAVQPTTSAQPGNTAATQASVLSHNTNEQTLKKIKIQQLWSTLLLLAAAALAVFAADREQLLGLAGIAVALLWKFVLIPAQKWWHHG